MRVKLQCRKVTPSTPSAPVPSKSPHAPTIKARPSASYAADYASRKPSPFPKAHLHQVIQISQLPIHFKKYNVISEQFPPVNTAVLSPVQPSRRKASAPAAQIDKENMHACLKPCLPLKKIIQKSGEASKANSRPGSARVGSPLPPPKKYEEGRSTIEILEKALDLKMPKRAKFSGRYLAKATIF